MAHPTFWPPQLRRYKKYARLRWKENGRSYEFLCGPWDFERDAPSLDAERERLRILAEHAAGHEAERRSASSITVVELIAAYTADCKQHYDAKQLHRVRQALRPVVRLFGDLPVDQFDGPRLKKVQKALEAHRYCRRCRRTEKACRKRARQQAADRAAGVRHSGRLANVQCEAGFDPRPYTRRHLNHLVGIVRRMFRWGKTEGMVPPHVTSILDDVPDLARKKTTAPDRPPVRAVAADRIEATLPYLTPIVADMVRVQRYTGMRPGEVCVMRPCDLDSAGAEVGGVLVWKYSRDEHKGDWRGQPFERAIGPQAQAVLAKYLDGRDPENYLFSPREAFEASLARRRNAARDGKRAKRVRRPKRQPGERYTTMSYGQAIRKACVRAGVPPWTPHQIRHTVGTEMFTADGRDGSMAVLGHDSPAANVVYAEKFQRAARLAARFG